MAAVSTGKSGLVRAESVAGRSVVLMLDLSAVTTAVASGGRGEIMDLELTPMPQRLPKLGNGAIQRG
jgi:hypothetical protein